MSESTTQEKLQLEIARLRSNWLSEQKQRLEQAEMLELYGAAKAKNEIERLKSINARLLKACHAALNVQYVNEVRDQLKAAIEKATNG